LFPLQEAERVKRERDLARMREEDEAREADRREDERRRRDEEDRLQVTPTVRTCGEPTLTGQLDGQILITLLFEIVSMQWASLN